MLTLLIIAAVAVLVALVRGGSLASLAATKVRCLWLIYAGVLLQAGAAIVLAGGTALVVVLMSNALLVVFMATNHRLPGMTLAALGLVLNVVVIATNGAMPVSSEVVEAAGGEAGAEIGGIKHEPMSDDTRLGFLGDVIAVPVVREVLSLGDVLLALGVSYFLYVRATAEARRGRHSVIE